MDSLELFPEVKKYEVRFFCQKVKLQFFAVIHQKTEPGGKTFPNPATTTRLRQKIENF